VCGEGGVCEGGVVTKNEAQYENNGGGGGQSIRWEEARGARGEEEGKGDAKGRGDDPLLYRLRAPPIFPMVPVTPRGAKRAFLASCSRVSDEKGRGKPAPERGAPSFVARRSRSEREDTFPSIPLRARDTTD
jgi:hypothetical protein